MPIIGLTDRKQSLFPRLGLLRKGAPKPKDSKEPGKDLTYFRLVTEDPRVFDAFFAAYGAEPPAIHVRFMGAWKADNFEAWKEEHGSGSLKHRCDGETCVLWQDQAGQYHTSPPEPTKPCPGGCTQVGKLRVVIPELVRLGYLEVLTGSKWDIIELDSNLDAAEAVAGLMGVDLRTIPFVLSRVPRKISTPRKGGPRVKVEKWLLHLEPDPVWVAFQEEMARQMGMRQIVPPAAPPDLVAETEEEMEEPLDAEPEPTNGNGDGHRVFGRADFIARIRALEQEAADLGQPVHYDEATLDEAKPDELKAIGRELRAKVDALWGKQEQAALL